MQRCQSCFRECMQCECNRNQFVTLAEVEAENMRETEKKNINQQIDKQTRKKMNAEKNSHTMTTMSAFP